MNKGAKEIANKLLENANITINGNQPWDIQVHDENFYSRAIRQGPLGLGETYMEKAWDCQRLDIFFERVLSKHLENKINIPFRFYLKMLLAKLINLQSKTRAKEVAHKHYNLGNELFSVMLDKNMQYSCGYWKEAKTLDEAQEAKLKLICDKLQLQPGQRLLDIGCGFGGLAKYAATHYGVSVVGVTISEEQYQFAVSHCKGLPVKISLQDYRDLNETFDRVVSVGMFEHVGYLNYATFMETANRVLADNGLFLLHTIGCNEFSSLANEWITKYIFPNGMLPSISLIQKASEKFFVLEDLQNFGGYYDNTLMAWHDNFIKHWEHLKSHYDERFYRMWTYYLLSCAGSFRARSIQLWQFVFSKSGIPGVYISPR